MKSVKPRSQQFNQIYAMPMLITYRIIKAMYDVEKPFTPKWFLGWLAAGYLLSDRQRVRQLLVALYWVKIYLLYLDIQDEEVSA